MANYYEILNVSQNASNKEIKSSYRRLARKLHPDTNNGSESTARQFAAIAEAYEVLGRPKDRAEYDKRLLQARFDASGNGDSVFASSNSHARRWRQMVYEHRYNEIIDRMIADERRESMALQKVLFPMVALFVSIFVVTMVKPQVFVKSAMIGKIVLVSLFAAGVIHLYGRIKEGLDRFTYNDDEIHDSILDDSGPIAKPYSRIFAGGILAAGVVLSFVFGLLVGSQVEVASASLPNMFSPTLQPEFVFYPPIFVLVVDLVHSVALRAEA